MPESSAVFTGIVLVALAIYGGTKVVKATNNHVVKPIYHHVVKPITHVFKPQEKTK